MAKAPAQPKPRRITVLRHQIKFSKLVKGKTMESFLHEVDEVRAKYAEYSFIYKYEVNVDVVKDPWSGDQALAVKVVRTESDKEFFARVEKLKIAQEKKDEAERKKAEAEQKLADKKAEELRQKEMALYEKLKAKYG
jgi:hypothetical protein